MAVAAPSYDESSRVLHVPAPPRISVKTTRSTIENVFEGVENARRGLEGARDQLRELNERVAKLEGSEELLIEKAFAASAFAGTHPNPPPQGGRE
jgi:hypothetical protein